MLRLSPRSAAFAGVALSAATGAVLLIGAAGAQTPPSPPPGVNVRCEIKPISAEEIAQMRAKLAAHLAQALGKPQAEVERALEKVDSELRANAGNVIVSAMPAAGLAALPAAPGVPAPLADIATRLGVTVQELEAAMKAAAPPPDSTAQPIQCEGAPDGQAGAVFFTSALKAPPFDEIARHLGRGITGEQVRAAFEASRPAGSVVPANSAFAVADDAVTVEIGGKNEYFEALARELNVSVEQIRAAFQSISPPVVRVQPSPTPR